MTFVKGAEPHSHSCGIIRLLYCRIDYTLSIAQLLSLLINYCDTESVALLAVLITYRSFVGLPNTDAFLRLSTRSQKGGLF